MGHYATQALKVISHLCLCPLRCFLFVQCCSLVSETIDFFFFTAFPNSNGYLHALQTAIALCICNVNCLHYAPFAIFFLVQQLMVTIDYFFFFLSLWVYLRLAETSQQPISQTTWLKATPHCNHCNQRHSTWKGCSTYENEVNLKKNVLRSDKAVLNIRRPEQDKYNIKRCCIILH